MNILIKIIYQASRFILLIFKPMTNGVRTLLVREDQVLLVKHVYEDKWYLPGGLVEKGETLDEAIRREAFEEVGVTMHDLRLFGTYTNLMQGSNDHISVFVSQDFSMSGHPDYEIEALSFFQLDALPEKISSGSRNRVNDFINHESVRYGHW